MSISQIEEIAKALAERIVESMKNGELEQRYLMNIDEKGDLSGYPPSAYDHQGVYGFCVTKDDKSAAIYIGKSEQDNRLRQHLTGKNKDGTTLASSVRTKNLNIKATINDGFSVYLCLYSSSEFKKASLACIEIASSLYAKRDMKIIFPNIRHWNERIG